MGGAGASREGGGCGVCDAFRGGTWGVLRGSTTISVGSRGVRCRCDPGRLLNSFMRFVESVRRNCVVKSAAQFSARGCCDGTGLRRGTPLWSAMGAVSSSSVVGAWW